MAFRFPPAGRSTRRVIDPPATQSKPPPHPGGVAGAAGRAATEVSGSGQLVREVVGAEVLLIDRDETVRAGMVELLSASEIHVTAVADLDRARRLLRRHFFSVVVVDFDTPAAGAGLEVVAAVRAASPTSALVVLAPRKSFDDAVAAVRAGAVDVIVKSPESRESIKGRIAEAAARSLELREAHAALRDVRETYEEFLKRFMDAERRVLDLDERLSGKAERGDGDTDIRILVVANQPQMAAEMSAGAPPHYRITGALSGGEALDRCGQWHFHVVMIAEGLHDLPPSMVARSIKASTADTMVVGLSETASGVSLDIIEGDQRVPLADQIGGPADLLARLDEVTEVYRMRERERRYLQAIRERHYDFLRRYAMLKARIDRLVGQ
jgi:DNA-binding NarL/FixJ family response regulator